MTTTRNFHLGDILSITTGRLVSPRHMDGIYDILNFMSGDNLFTHQLPRVMREAQPADVRACREDSPEPHHPSITGVTVMRRQTEHTSPRPALFPVPAMPVAREPTLLPFAHGDRLLCAGMTREASIELLRLCPGYMANAMLPKLIEGKREGGPDQATVYDWLCAQGYAWRPPGMNTSEVRLTPGGQEKARGVLIYVASGHW